MCLKSEWGVTRLIYNPTWYLYVDVILAYWNFFTFYMHLFSYSFLRLFNYEYFPQLAGAVEYTDCTSAEYKTPQRVSLI